MSGLTIVIPRNGPGDGPVDPDIWRATSVGGTLLQPGGSGATFTDPAGLLAPDGSQAMRLVVPSVAGGFNTQVIATSEEVTGLVIPQGGPFTLSGYVKASKPVDVVNMHLSEAGSGANRMSEVWAYPSATTSWLPFSRDFLALVALNGTQGIRFTPMTSGGAMMSDVTVDLAVKVSAPPA